MLLSRTFLSGARHFHPGVNSFTSALTATMSTTARVVPHNLSSSSELWESAPSGEKPAKVGTTRIFYKTAPEELTALSSLGEGFENKNGNVKKELVRKAVGSAVKAIKDLDGVKTVKVDATHDAHASGMCSALYIPPLLSIVFCSRCGASRCVFLHVKDLTTIPIQSQSQRAHSG